MSELLKNGTLCYLREGFSFFDQIQIHVWLNTLLCHRCSHFSCRHFIWGGGGGGGEGEGGAAGVGDRVQMSAAFLHMANAES
jgi:hypothetical protein